MAPAEDVAVGLREMDVDEKVTDCRQGGVKIFLFNIHMEGIDHQLYARAV
jgi:hypothetical protein